MRLPRRLLFAFTLPLPILLVACGGGGGSGTTAGLADASELRSEEITISAVTVQEKRGLFGPDLGFVLRLPEGWNGRLLVAIPGAAGLAGDLDDFATPEVAAGTAYASIDSSDALSAPALYEDFLRFVIEQVRVAYGRDPDGRYLMGISQGGWQVQRMLEGGAPLVDGALVVAPWSPAEALRSYPAVLSEVDKLHGDFAGIAAGSLARLDAAELLIVEGLFQLGLPAGSEPGWPGTVDFWIAAVGAAQALIDPTYPESQPAAAYELPLRPADVRKRVEAVTPAGKLAVPTILLQGGLDIVALPAWSSAYEARVLAAKRERGLRVFVFRGVDHTLRAASEDETFTLARLRRGWESLTGWVEAGAEPQVILGVAPTVVAAR